MGRELFEIIDRLLCLTRLDPGRVGEALGIALTPIDEGDPPFATYFGSADPLAEVAGVELRCPGPKSRMEDGLLILTLSPDLDVPIYAIRARFGFEESFDPRPPEAPESAPSYTTYHLGGARLAFGFLDPAPGTPGIWPSRLVYIVIDRTGC